MITSNRKHRAKVKSVCALFLARGFCYFHFVSRSPTQGLLMISIDDFRKIELKVATVKSAEPHPNADKLMVLQIDLGSEQRKIWSANRSSSSPIWKPPSSAAWRARACFWRHRMKGA